MKNVKKNRHKFTLSIDIKCNEKCFVSPRLENTVTLRGEIFLNAHIFNYLHMDSFYGI